MSHLLGAAPGSPLVKRRPERPLYWGRTISQQKRNGAINGIFLSYRYQVGALP